MTDHKGVLLVSSGISKVKCARFYKSVLSVDEGTKCTAVVVSMAHTGKYTPCL